MNALNRALDMIHSSPDRTAAQVLSALIESLDRGMAFDLSRLYALNYGEFTLAVEVLRAWRLDSYRYERGWASRMAVGDAPAEALDQLSSQPQEH